MNQSELKAQIEKMEQELAEKKRALEATSQLSHQGISLADLGVQIARLTKAERVVSDQKASLDKRLQELPRYKAEAFQAKLRGKINSFKHIFYLEQAWKKAMLDGRDSITDLGPGFGMTQPIPEFIQDIDTEHAHMLERIDEVYDLAFGNKPPKAWEPPPYQMGLNKVIRGINSSARGYIDYHLTKDRVLQKIREADDATYDTIYYFIGGFDFDIDDPQTTEDIYEICLTIATVNARCRYTPSKPRSELYKNLYRYQTSENAHPSIRARVLQREKREREALRQNRIYVPDSEQAIAFKKEMGEWFKRSTTEEMIKEHGPPKDLVLEKKVDCALLKITGIGCVLIFLCLLMINPEYIFVTLVVWVSIMALIFMSPIFWVRKYWWVSLFLALSALYSQLTT